MKAHLLYTICTVCASLFAVSEAGGVDLGSYDNFVELRDGLRTAKDESTAVALLAKYDLTLDDKVKIEKCCL